MIYEEYEAMWSKIRNKEKELFDLITKRDQVFERTQPKSPKLDKELVDGKNPVNMMDHYVIEIEYYDIKINQLNQTLDDLYQILRRKREELKLSKNLYDRLYYYFCIERLSVYKIASLVHYSQSKIYRKLEKMSIEVKDAKKCENFHDKMIL